MSMFIQDIGRALSIAEQTFFTETGGKKYESKLTQTRFYHLGVKITWTRAEKRR
jgi:hypothetical protein